MSRPPEIATGCWTLTGGNKELGYVVPDDHVPGMFRTIAANGRVSDMMSLSDAKDALVAMAGLRWQKEQRRESALPAGWTRVLRTPKRAEA